MLHERSAERLLVVQRTRSRPEAATLEAASREAMALAGDCEGWGLVIDTRLAPGRDEETFEAKIDALLTPGRDEGTFEAKIDALRGSLRGVFAKVAAVVQTAAGELQARRMESPRQYGTYLTRDLDDAIEHVRP